MSGSVFLDSLLPASWRGLPFAVRGSEYSGGRRVAVHEYPYRDDVWVEDLGRAPRPIAFSGFVTGDDCAAQAQAMIAAGEQRGPGTLVHPTLGERTVALVEPIRATERAELGRVVELTFSFLGTRDPIYPDAEDDTAGGVDDAADDTEGSLAENFSSALGDALDQGTAAVGSAIGAVQGWVGTAQRLAGDASLVTHAVAGLVPGVGATYGRYATGLRGSVLSGVSTAAGALSAVTRARSAVSSAAGDALSLAEGL